MKKYSGGIDHPAEPGLRETLCIPPRDRHRIQVLARQGGGACLIDAATCHFYRQHGWEPRRQIGHQPPREGIHRGKAPQVVHRNNDTDGIS